MVFLWEGSLSRLQEKERGGLPYLGGEPFPACRNRKGWAAFSGRGAFPACSRAGCSRADCSRAVAVDDVS